MLTSPKHGFRDPRNLPLKWKLGIAAYIYKSSWYVLNKLFSWFHFDGISQNDVEKIAFFNYTSGPVANMHTRPRNT